MGVLDEKCEREDAFETRDDTPGVTQSNAAYSPSSPRRRDRIRRWRARLSGGDVQGVDRGDVQGRNTSDAQGDAQNDMDAPALDTDGQQAIAADGPDSTTDDCHLKSISPVNAARLIQLPQPESPLDQASDPCANAISLFGVFEDRLMAIRKHSAASPDSDEDAMQPLRRSRTAIMKRRVVSMRLGTSPPVADKKLMELRGGGEDGMSSSLSSQLRKSKSMLLRRRPFTKERDAVKDVEVEGAKAGTKDDETANKLATRSPIKQRKSEDSFVTLISTERIVTETAVAMPPRANANAAVQESATVDDGIIEDMHDGRRRLVAGHLHTLFRMLANPDIDETYPAFTRDFLLTYRYHCTDHALWTGLRELFDEWSEALTMAGERPSTPCSLTTSVSDEERASKPWLMVDRDALQVLMRIISLMTAWLQDYSYLTFIPMADRKSSDDTWVEQQYDAQIALLREMAAFVELRLSGHAHKQVRSCSGPLRMMLVDKFAFHGMTYPARSQSPRGSTMDPDAVVDVCDGNATAHETMVLPTQATMSGKEAKPVTSPATTSPTTPPSKRSPTNHLKTHADLLSLDQNELFRQLTLIELDLFRLVRPLDLLLKSKGKLDHAPSLKRLIQRFNHVSYWVATELCMCRDVKTRVEVLKLFLSVARKCFKYRNFNTCLQIVAALSMTCVQRLKRTWKLLPNKHMAIWTELSATFSASRNYQNYRKEVLSKLEETTDAAVDTQPGSMFHLSRRKFAGGIPFMGIHLSDLVYIEETAGKDRFADGMINFAKMRLIAETFKRLMDLQKRTNYDFVVEPFTRRFLTYDTLMLDDDKLWRASRIIEEPPQQLCRLPTTDGNDQDGHQVRRPPVLTITTTADDEASFQERRTSRSWDAAGAIRLLLRRSASSSGGHWSTKNDCDDERMMSTQDAVAIRVPVPSRPLPRPPRRRTFHTSSVSSSSPTSPTHRLSAIIRRAQLATATSTSGVHSIGVQTEPIAMVVLPSPAPPLVISPSLAASRQAMGGDGSGDAGLHRRESYTAVLRRLRDLE